MSAPRTVSLVLGSGGARGLAHISVIQALVNNGFYPLDCRRLHGGAGRRDLRWLKNYYRGHKGSRLDI